VEQKFHYDLSHMSKLVISRTVMLEQRDMGRERERRRKKREAYEGDSVCIDQYDENLMLC
jgi:hypothetical protein